MKNGSETFVIHRLAKRHLNRDLTESQSELLWTECQSHLVSKGLKSTVREVKESTDGVLDSLIRGDVLSAIGFILAGEDWPINASTPAYSKRFRALITAEMDRRGYKETIEPADSMRERG